jgi:hypothetical protein
MKVRAAAAGAIDKVVFDKLIEIFDI